MEDTTKQLINHISRLEGQLRAVKAELSSGTPDCEKASTTLRAASRSFSSLRKSFIQCFLEKKYMSRDASLDDSQYLSLLNLING